MAEHYGVDFKIEHENDVHFMNRMIGPALKALGKHLGVDFDVLVRGEVISIEAKKLDG